MNTNERNETTPTPAPMIPLGVFDSEHARAMLDALRAEPSLECEHDSEAGTMRARYGSRYVFAAIEKSAGVWIVCALDGILSQA